MTPGIEPRTAAAFRVEPAKPEDRAGLIQMYLEFEPKGAALGLPPRKNPETWLDALSEFPNFVVKAAGRASARR